MGVGEGKNTVRSEFFDIPFFTPDSKGLFTQTAMAIKESRNEFFIYYFTEMLQDIF